MGEHVGGGRRVGVVAPRLSPRANWRRRWSDCSTRDALRLPLVLAAAPVPGDAVQPPSGDRGADAGRGGGAAGHPAAGGARARCGGGRGRADGGDCVGAGPARARVAVPGGVAAAACVREGPCGGRAAAERPGGHHARLWAVRHGRRRTAARRLLRGRPPAHAAPRRRRRARPRLRHRGHHVRGD